MDNPKVSIGLPVYNGEAYLAQAIESVLNQSFADLELIISDNASTDGTQDICRDYVSRNPRISYHRNEKNHGAASNFNRAFERARGEYFQWLAHDDLLCPDFVERCLSVLEADPSTILCFPWVRVIDENGKQVDSWELQFNVDVEEPWIRYRDILFEWHNSLYVFGLIRASALRDTKLILPHAHGDTILLARLSLLGRFHQIPEYLFLSRYHPNQSNRMHDAELPRGLDLVAYTAWFDARVAKKLRHPYWRVMAAYYDTLRDIDLNWIARVLCNLTFARLLFRYRYGLLWDFGGLPRRFARMISSLPSS